jgi:choline-sulfatase
MLAACSGGPRQVAHDLVAELAIAEVLQETPMIDAGTAGARRWLAAGWYPDEGGDGAPDFAWSEGDESVLELIALEPRTVEAELRCRPYAPRSTSPQVVRVGVNGEALASLELGGGFATYPLSVPAGLLRAGRNSLVFDYPQARSPRELGLGDDWRRLAFAVDWLRLAPGDPPPPPCATAAGDGLTIPIGTSLGYSMRFTDGLRLEIDRVAATSGVSCRFRCNVVRDGAPAVTVAELGPGERPQRIDLTGSRGEAFRLELQAAGVAPGQGYGGALELIRPRVTEPAVTASAAAAGEPAPPAAGARANIVIYLVDALRADRLGVYGQPLPLSPRLDGFAARATVYEQAWAQSSWTRPVVASLFTGLQPEVHGVNGRLDRLGGGMATLAERLGRAGYATAAVVANPNASATFGLDRGFDEFVLMPADRRRSSDVHAEAVRWLDSHDGSRPFLLYVHTVDPHLPYDPPDRQRARFAPSVARRDLGSTEVVGTLLARDLVDEARWAGDLLALYDAEVASNDESFGALLDELDRRGLSEGTTARSSTITAAGSTAEPSTARCCTCRW